MVYPLWLIRKVFLSIMKESPLFVNSFETLLWILEHTRKFPKHQRFVMAKRIREADPAMYQIIKGNNTWERREYSLEAIFDAGELAISADLFPTVARTHQLTATSSLK